MPITIVSTEVKVHAGTTTSGTQVGSTITLQGSPTDVNLDVTTLGVALSPGSQYCCVARCTNSESSTTEWTSPYLFKSLILAEFTDLTGGCGRISPEMQFTYDSNVLSVTDCGIYASTNASGTNAVKISAGDEQQAGQGWYIETLNEHTTYYCVAYVVDSDGREFREDWSDAEQVNTGYKAPTVAISNIATTYNSVSGNVSASTNDTLSSAYVTLQASGGGTVYRKNLTASTSSQSFSFTDGGTDDNGVTIVISPSTEYRVVAYYQNTSGCSGNAVTTATTSQQQTSTIAIGGIDNITPTSAVAHLLYAVGD